jgi:hypothetical protein
MTMQTAHQEDAESFWAPLFSPAGAMVAVLVAAALAVAGLLTQDLQSMPPFGDLIGNARMLFANFMIIVLVLFVGAAWLLAKNARELHALRSELRRKGSEQ